MPPLTTTSSKRPIEGMFGEARSMTASPPNDTTWANICTLTERALRAHPRAASDQLVPYLLAHLIHWPHSARSCPAPWLYAVLHGTRAPWLVLVRAIRATLRPDDLIALARSPSASHIHHLHLPGGAMTRDAASSLARSTHLKHLDHLSIPWGRVDPGALGALLLAAPMRTLQSLVLHSVDLRDDALRALALTRPASLRTLSLRHNKLTSHGLTSLARAPLPMLGELDLADNALGARATAALARAPFATSLEVLCLDTNPLGVHGVHQLDTTFGSLHTLSCRNTALGDDGVDVLAGSSLTQHLQHLALDDNDITERGCSALALAPFRRLRTVSLRGNPIGARGAMALAQAPWLPGLSDLALTRHHIGEDGVRALLHSRRLSDDARASLEGATSSGASPHPRPTI